MIRQLRSIFAMGLGLGVVLTILAASGRLGLEGRLQPAIQVPAVTQLPRGVRTYTAANDADQAFDRARQQSAASASPLLRDSDLRPDFWIETISDLPAPRMYLLHNLLREEECLHLKALGVMKGMQAPVLYTHHSSQDSTQEARANHSRPCDETLYDVYERNNSAAFLDFQLDPTVARLERILANITHTHPENGERLQILHYAATEEFKLHRDYFDPVLDPPGMLERGGNRLATALVYLENAREGGETFFPKLGKKIRPSIGSALLFYNLKPSGAVDEFTTHAGTAPIGGEKWVATKWIHQGAYQRLFDEKKRKIY